MIILHCADKNKWEEDVKLSAYGISEVSKHGFIPCIDASCVTPDNFTFPSMKEYIILCINTDKIDANISYENGIKVYGTIPTEAVISTIEYTFDGDDRFIVSDKIKDIAILNDALSALNVPYVSHKYFRDGTDSRIILLNGVYIIKQNNPKLLESEALFSKWYKSPKLQEVIYSDKDYRYIIYNFVPGDVMHTVDDFNDAVSNIKEIVQGYKKYDEAGFGYIYEPSASWEDFLKALVHEHSLTLPEAFNYLPKVYEAINELANYSFEKKLIHGDFGTHNFIKENGKFVAAIDPIPIAGDALYDLIFALISNVAFLPHISLDFLCELSGEPKEKVKALLTVLLFCRLDTCVKYNKEDLEDYLDFWYKVIE